MSLRIVKGYFSNGTATSFATYTVYVVRTAPDDDWVHVVTAADRDIGYNFHDAESGDATLEAVGFYVEDKRLYAVRATKIGAAADRNGPRKTPFDIEVEVFNDSDEIPMFNHMRKQRSKGAYVDATEVLQREFFRR